MFLIKWAFRRTAAVSKASIRLSTEQSKKHTARKTQTINRAETSISLIKTQIWMLDKVKIIFLPWDL